MAAGYTWNPPKEDRHMYSRSKFLDDIAMMLGGRVAEEETFSEITTGAESDLRQATKLARKMVTEYGMSKKMGPLTFGHKEELVFLGRELGEHKNYSERVASEIDDEISQFIQESYEKAQKVVREHKPMLSKITEKLLKEETIEEAEFAGMFKASKKSKEEKAS
jgi:cell division protease FtsH